MKNENGLRIDRFFFESTYSIEIKKEAIRHEPGVYVILSESPGALIPFMVLDIGESEDVCSTIQAHERKECWLKYAGDNPVTVAILYENVPGKRKQVAQELRKKFKPPCGPQVISREPIKTLEYDSYDENSLYDNEEK